jgi:hypothetical protein
MSVTHDENIPVDKNREDRAKMSSHHRVTKAASALASFFIVAAAALYVFGPTKAALSVTVTSQPTTHSKQLSSAGLGPLVPSPSFVLTSFVRKPAANPKVPSRGHHHPRGPKITEVIYGSVKGPDNTVPVDGFLSLVRRPSVHSDSYTSIPIGTDGTFQTTVSLLPGFYVLFLRAEFGSKWYASSEVVKIVPGRTYGVSAVLRYESVFTFLPVTSY